LLNWFKGAKIYTAYEAGFSGFGLHRELDSHKEIKSIVVNAASIAVAANDKVKTDLRDSKKIAEQLSVNRLRGIYIPTEKEESRRTLTRTREQVVDARATTYMDLLLVSTSYSEKLFIRTDCKLEDRTTNVYSASDRDCSRSHDG
jgi:transposase